ncbi:MULTISPECIES: hypothetical protein [unclassified Paraflavitalea]|uniref:hypothetical protein n=1 Tax=unclassified Paraflavitalea TaxID=2798305 RepID=UPI003D331117
MNRNLNIVSICKDPEIGAVMKRLLEQEEGWTCISCTCPESVSMLLEKNTQIDAVLVGSGLSDEEEQNIQQQVASLNSFIPIVHHYGGGSGLIWAEIKSALGIKN